MTLTDRAVSIFGNIAVKAGYYEATMGERPVYVVMSSSDADTLLTYYATRGTKRVSAQIARDRLVMVSGLEVHIARMAKAPLRVG